MTDYYDFDADFNEFENNPEIQKTIERILRSNDPLMDFEWIKDKQQQIQGIDLIIKKFLKTENIDIKAITYAENHHYLDDISIELASNYDLFIKTKGKQGKSWLFKENNETDKLLYYWLDINNEVKESIVLIDFNSLREWGSYFFNIFELYPFLNAKTVKECIKNHKYKSQFLGTLKGFEIFSAKNKGYFTINLKITLSYLNKVFHQFSLSKISIITEKEPKKDIIIENKIIGDFF